MPQTSHHTIVLDWLNEYICKSHSQLGRSGSICPHVRPALKAGQLDFVYQHGISGEDAGQLSEVLTQELRKFSELHPDPAGYRVSLASALIVFPDIDPGHYHVLDQIYPAMKNYAVKNGLMVGQFHPDCNEPAFRNPIFPVSRSPIPLVAVRHMGIHDILFLGNTGEWYHEYRQRFGRFCMEGRLKDPLMIKMYETAENKYQEDVRRYR
ncbi:DUF6875 domain-containing protein [Nocardia terpenica]|uniref:DUF6875 domain-containing protein n=1 Tax=Nocardia terpenica TaxID=455432 RepID=A0A6G9Z9D8_9NOCA|nr:hypothetical protein [Nocardia terpenica]QIS22148.1 hypothetical protein F6W96_31190 [Nocardia terpenica]